jgi:hypothetical protein
MGNPPSRPSKALITREQWLAEAAEGRGETMPKSRPNPIPQPVSIPQSSNAKLLTAMSQEERAELVSKAKQEASDQTVADIKDPKTLGRGGARDAGRGRGRGVCHGVGGLARRGAGGARAGGRDVELDGQPA